MAHLFWNKLLGIASQIRPAYFAIVFAMVLAASIVMSRYMFEELYQFTRAYEDWELDEILPLFAVLAFTFLALLFVHRRDLKREIIRRLTSESRLETAINNMPIGLSMFDSEQRLIVCNSMYREIYDLPESLTQTGTPFAEIIRYHSKMWAGPDGAEGLKSQRKWIEQQLAEVASGEAFTYTRNLSERAVVNVSNQPMPGGGWVDVHENITERRRHETKIAHMAHHDALTDLYNRVMLGKRIEKALTRVRQGEGMALHLLDLDEFKVVNDTLGHPVGDGLLKAVAGRLRGVVRDTDTIARMGGDEFAIIQVGIEKTGTIANFAQRVIDTISEPYAIGGHDIKVGASVGIAIAPVDGNTADQLIKSADLALYRAKERGRGVCCFYDEELSARVRSRQQLETDLRGALTAGEFELHYQPLLNLEEYQVTGFEALMRWHHPERGMIPPGGFISLAEESGLIVPLGEWAIRQACNQAMTWPERVNVAVNISPLQFKRPGLVEVVTSALASSGLPAGRLELEITESVLLDHSDANLATLHRLRELGVRIALDDFGTGYSSLSYLQSFPFDKIKIDHSFIRNITATHDSIKIVRAIVMLARSLGMKTTAEGIETEAQHDAVRLEGCDEIQGYFVSRPRPARDVERLLLPRARPKHNSQNGQAERKLRMVS